jgi:hypothetical protein
MQLRCDEDLFLDVDPVLSRRLLTRPSPENSVARAGPFSGEWLLW